MTFANRLHCSRQIAFFLTWVIMLNAEERNPNTDRSEIVWDKRR